MLKPDPFNDMIEEAQWAKYEPSFARVRVRPTGAQLAGKRYEAAALLHLYRSHKAFVPLPWLTYKYVEDSSWKWCQPDGVLFDFAHGRICVVECKIRHTAQAFSKLNDIYLPVLKLIFPETLWQFSGVEFTKAYDCAVKLPVRVSIHDLIEEVPSNKFGVVVWNPLKKLN